MRSRRRVKAIYVLVLLLAGMAWSISGLRHIMSSDATGRLAAGLGAFISLGLSTLVAIKVLRKPERIFSFFEKYVEPDRLSTSLVTSLVAATMSVFGRARSFRGRHRRNVRTRQRRTNMFINVLTFL